MTRAHILPPNATALERGFDQTFPAWDALADANTSPSEGTPDALSPWKAAELGIAEFSPYFETTQALLAAGLPWLFKRGTAAGVRLALGWLGFDGVVIEEDGPYLHINLGRVATAEELAAVRHVVLATLPAHVRFYRVFFENDQRPIWLDRGPPLDVGLLDNDSGIDSEGPKASFGARHAAVLTAPATAGLGQATTQIRCALISYADRAILDAWHLDSQILLDAYGGLSELYAGTCNAPEPLAPHRSQGQQHDAIAAWAAPLPERSAEHLHTLAAPVPTQARRRWSGPWSGPWRASIPLNAYEEN